MKRIALAACLLFACGRQANNNDPNNTGPTGETGSTGTSSPSGPTGPTEPTEEVVPSTASATIGPSGGKLTLGVLEVQFPKNAVAQGTLVSVTRSDASVAGYKLFSQLFSLEPSSLALGAPFIVVIPFADASQEAKLYWTSAADQNVFEAIPSQIVRDTVIAVVDRMGKGFVGELIPEPIDVTEPPAPANVVAHAGDTEIDVTWSAAAQASLYQVEYSATPGGPYSPLGTTTLLKFTHTARVNGATAYYVVRAINAAGDSDPSEEASATPDAIDAPDSVSLTPGNAQITVQWSASTYASTHSKYNLYRSDLVAPIQTTASLQFVDTNLENGRRYSYTVKGVNVADVESLDASIATETFPYALPTMLVAAQASGATNCDYTFSWAAPADGADFYSVGAEFSGGDFYDLSASVSVSAANHSVSCVLAHGDNQTNSLTLNVQVCYTDPVNAQSNCSPGVTPAQVQVIVLDDTMSDACLSGTSDDVFTCRSP